MTPQRPYLLRALYDWLVDNDDVPYVLVDAAAEGVNVPQEHVKDGQIVLNIGPNAVRNLVLEQDYVMCGSRFSGREFELYLPMPSIRAIYGRDTRQGMVFPEEEFSSENSPAAPVDEESVEQEQAARPPLRLV